MHGIDCIHSDRGCWCKNKQVKRSLLGLGARMCRVFERKECEYQERHPKPQTPPPHAPSSPKGALLLRSIDLVDLYRKLEARYRGTIPLHEWVNPSDIRPAGVEPSQSWSRHDMEFIFMRPLGVVPEIPSPPPAPPKKRSTETPIFKATSRKTGEVHWITDLYWFEEEGIHGMDGRGHYEDYDLEFVGKSRSDMHEEAACSPFPKS